ncbi:WYL domain-containing protein [Mangrovimonas sp. AS39]|uniref:helix-turn-helix transcriptional regulator n=1 Tax=Mangrovimonas futianensis TaxID=2895523 RepID=UPI001E4F7316|nr:WYL domain-containing protein [Mangrovimonas futianensis]MCF1190111.1 WYL domain-containing protein [Mangrovimonas futianensis]MCF1194138.1 WYL domain-containing protein [Mangrovimonas futianensis]
MSKYEIPRRLSSIIQYIKDKEAASKEQILTFLESNDFKTSERTLSRDLSKIRTDLGLEIHHVKQSDTYQIDNDKSIKVDSFLKFIEFITLADIFADGLKESRDILDYVSFNDMNRLKGLENLEIILRAIKEERKLSFTHYNYYKNTHTDYIITPLIIKEYLNRWYVVGVPDGLSEIRSFGIDRLKETQLDGLAHFHRKQYQDQLDQFNHIIGLNFSGKQKELIVLKVNNNHLKYLKSLPLHPSQKLTPSKEEGFSNVMYHVIPNYELDIQILKMSLEVEVLKPIWYREHIKSQIETIFKKYQD